MAQLELKRGQNEKITALPLLDGQLLVGFQENGKASLYIDANVNGNVVRFTIGSSDVDYSSIISGLTDRITVLENSTGIDNNITLLEIDENIENDNPPILSKFKLGYRDKVVIPDLYNCGANENTVFKTLATQYTDIASDEEKGAITNQGSFYVFNPSRGANKSENLPNGRYIFSDIDFSDKYFQVNGGNGNDVTLVFENCKFGTIKHATQGYNEDKSTLLKLEFNNCTIKGIIQGSLQTYNNCLITGEGEGKDACNPIKSVHLNNCYIYNLLPNKVTSGTTHIDGLQTFGSTGNTKDENGNWTINYYSEDIVYNNVRITIPEFQSTVSSNAYISAGIFLAPDYQGLKEVTIKDLIIDVASKYPPIRDFGGNGTANIKYDGIRVSNQYDKAFYNNMIGTDTTVNDVELQSKLYISTVVKENEGVKFSVTNCTTTDRTLKIVTNLGEETFNIPKCPSQVDLDDVRKTEFATTTINDLPYNVEKIIVGEIKYLVAYDGDTQIRFVDFTDDKHYTDKERDDIKFRQAYRDLNIIPDAYNTGLSDASLCNITVTEKNAQNRRFANNTDIAFKESTAVSRHGGTTLNLAVVVNVKDEYLFENVDFELYDINLATTIQGVVKFKNCKLNAIKWDSNTKLILENCDIQGIIRAGNVDIKKCKIHNTTGDCLFPLADPSTLYTFNVEDTYIYDVCNENSAIGDHIDGIQITGVGSVASPDLLPKVSMTNVRIAIPMFAQFRDISTDTGGVNGAIYIQGYRGTIAEGNMFKDIIIDGANVINPIDIVVGTSESTNIFDNVKISNQWSSPFRNNANKYYTEHDCGVNENLYISSVYKDNGKLFLIVTNNNNVDKILKVKTNVGEKEYSIAKSPSTVELMNNSEYSNYTFKDMAYDKIIEIENANEIEYIVCYDKNNQIRFVDFTDDKRYTL